jgi:ribosome biogenesis protein BMS1
MNSKNTIINKDSDIALKDLQKYKVETPEDLVLDEDDLEPPFVIVVQGSRQSGKTTLIKSLVQHFTK